jgi:hypothetical protein
LDGKSIQNFICKINLRRMNLLIRAFKITTPNPSKRSWRIVGWGQPGQIVLKTLSRNYSIQNRVGGVTQVAEHEAVWNPTTIKTKSLTRKKHARIGVIWLLSIYDEIEQEKHLHKRWLNFTIYLAVWFTQLRCAYSLSNLIKSSRFH